MDLLTIVGAIFARWFVVVPVLALTGYGAYLAVEQAEIEYTAGGSVLLVNPAGIAGETATTEAETDVGATEAGTDVKMSGSIVADIVQSDQVRLALAEQGTDAPYTVEAERDGTILRVTSTAEAPEGVVETVAAVLDQIVVAVEGRQNDAGIAPERHITVETLVEPVEATQRAVRDDATGNTVTRWSASGVALLIDPPPPPQSPSNPLEASRYLANVLAREMGDGRLRQTILDSSAVHEYSVREERTDAAPILYLSVTGTQPGEVMRTYDDLIEILDTRLAETQAAAEAPEGTWVSLRPLSSPLEPEADTSGALRPALTIVALGVFAAVSLAVLLDSVMASRRRTRRAGKAQEPEWIGLDRPAARKGNGQRTSRGRVITLPDPPDHETASRSEKGSEGRPRRARRTGAR